MNDRIKLAQELGLVEIDQVRAAVRITETGWDSLMAMLAVLSVAPHPQVARTAEALGTNLTDIAEDYFRRMN